MNMEVALPRDTELPDFDRVTKRLKDENGLQIVTANENPILDTRVYEVKYVDGHKASLTANTNSKKHICTRRRRGEQTCTLWRDNKSLLHCASPETSRRIHCHFMCQYAMSRDYKRIGYAHPMEGYLKELGPTEVHEIKLYISGKWICCTYTNIGGTCIFMVGFSCTAKKETDSWESKIQVLDSYIKLRLKVPKSVTEEIAIYFENGETLWWDSICKQMKKRLYRLWVIQGW